MRRYYNDKGLDPHYTFRCILYVAQSITNQESRRLTFNARLSEVSPVSGSLTQCTFYANGWVQRVEAFVEFPEDKAIDWQNTLKNWAISRTKVRIQGITRPENGDVLVKSITGTIEETLRGETQEEPNPLVGTKVNVWLSR